MRIKAPVKKFGRAPLRMEVLLAIAAIVGLVHPKLYAQPWNIVHGPIDELCAGAASSGNGSSIFGITGDSSDIYQSTNNGETWSLILKEDGYTVSCSANGAKIAVGGGPAISTNFGANFSQQLINGNISAWSANGNLLAAAGSGVSVTTNDGSTWTTAPLNAKNLKYLAVSANGEVIVTANQGSLFVSTNSGASWSTGITLTNGQWSAIACAADGTRIIGTAFMAPMRAYISRDSGKTWATEIPLGLSRLNDVNSNYLFSSLSSSADASLLVADIQDDIYISRDFGASWVYDNANSEAPVTCSTDGTLLVAAIGGYLKTQTLPPPLNIVASSNQLNLSWPARSSQYVLQQASDLTSTNWIPVTNTITVTNYRNTIILPPPVSGNAFYRLLGPN